MFMHAEMIRLSPCASHLMNSWKEPNGTSTIASENITGKNRCPRTLREAPYPLNHVQARSGTQSDTKSWPRDRRAMLSQFVFVLQMEKTRKRFSWCPNGTSLLVQLNSELLSCRQATEPLTPNLTRDNVFLKNHSPIGIVVSGKFLVLLPRTNMSKHQTRNYGKMST